VATEEARREAVVRGHGRAIEAARAELTRISEIASFRRHQLADLEVRAKVRGVVQDIPLENGQWVALGTLLAGVLAFFLLEKLVLWRHCHTGHECEVHTSSAASLVIIGDAFHTFVDGALIAAAVLTSIPLGATTAIAVAAHEIPQEVGDFAILLRAGYSRGRAFTLNILSAAGGVLGALAMLLASQWVPQVLPYVLSFAAGSFLYVAMADLIPDLHRGGVEGGPAKQLLLIGAGILTIVLL